MFSPANARAMSAYRQVGVQSMVDSASPQQLIKMLFDGLLASINAHAARSSAVISMKRCVISARPCAFCKKACSVPWIVKRRRASRQSGGAL